MFIKILLLTHFVVVSTSFAQVSPTPLNKKSKTSAPYVIIEKGQKLLRFEEHLQQKSDELLKNGYRLLLSDWKKIK